MAKERKLDLNRVLRALDSKDYGFYDRLTPEERKEFSPFVLVRFMSLVADKNSDMQEWYLRATHERVKDILQFSKEPKIQWLMLCTISPGLGNQFHKWLALKGNGKKADTKSIAYLEGLYPEGNEDELEILSGIYSTRDLKQHAKDSGWDDRQIKSDL